MLIARMSVQPTPARQAQINTLITALKAGGVWTKLDTLYLIAAHDAQAARLNWKGNATYDITAVSAPTFTTDRGYAGNGTSSYLDTNWAFSAGVNFTQDDASFGIWSRTIGQSAVNVAGSGTANEDTIVGRSGADTSGHRINCATNTSGAASTDGTGLWHAERTAATVHQLYRNGAANGAAGSQTSIARSSANFNLGRINTSAFAVTQFAAAFTGASFTAPQRAALYSALSTYLTAIGAV